MGNGAGRNENEKPSRAVVECGFTRVSCVRPAGFEPVTFRVGV